VAVVNWLPNGAFIKSAVALLVMVVVLSKKPEGLFGAFFEEERL
jgi:branched-chain amino acid transport system permease protein